MVHLKREKAHVYTADITYPQFSGLPDVQALNQKIGHQSREVCAKWVSGGGGVKDTWLHRLNGFEIKSDPVTAFPNLVSYVDMVYSDTGGAHPTYFYASSTWAYEGGSWKKLHIKDLFTSGADWLGKVRGVLDPMLKDKGAIFLWDGTVPTLPEEDANDFLVTKTGLRFYTSPYEVGPWAQGSFITNVPYSKFPDLDPNGPLKGILPSS